VLTRDHTALLVTHTFTYSGINHRLLAFISKPQSVTVLWPVFIFRAAQGRRLSWPEWLVTNRGGLCARRRSPTPVLTGPGVE